MILKKGWRKTKRWKTAKEEKRKRGKSLIRKQKVNKLDKIKKKIKRVK